MDFDMCVIWRDRAGGAEWVSMVESGGLEMEIKKKQEKQNF